MMYRKGKLALKILYVISAGIAIPSVLVAPNMAQVFMPLLRDLSKRLNSQPYRIRRSLTALKRNRLLKVEERGEKMVFTLTEHGKKRLLEGDFEKLSIPQPKKWDKKWRVVIFDVPEGEKKARDALRLKLRALGLYQLQKSCFVYPYDCRDQIDFVTEFFGISQYINCLLVEELEGERELREHFEV